MTVIPETWQPEVILANQTLRRVDFRDRVEAAAAAGCHSIGIGVKEYQALRAEGHTDAELRGVLESNGVRVVETEVVAGWDYPEDQRPEESKDRERDAFAMADALGVRHIVAVGALLGPLGPEPVAGFAAVCDRAAAHDLLVALEPQACTSITDLAMGVNIVEEADRPERRPQRGHLALHPGRLAAELSAGPRPGPRLRRTDQRRPRNATLLRLLH